MNGNKLIQAAVLCAFAVTNCLGETNVVRKIGIIGTDTWHALEFSKLINAEKQKPAYAGFRITHSYEWGSRDIEGSLREKEEYRPKLLKLGVKPVNSIAELLKNVDCVLLETNDGRPHLEQAIEVFKSGKLVFIDKPIAENWENVKAIYEAAKKYKAKWYSSSGLRYQSVLRKAKAGEYGKVNAAHMYTPAVTEPTQHLYFWYGIHGAEPLYAAMGPGCDYVRCFGAKDDDILVGTWKDGRIGEVRMCRSPWGQGACFHDGTIVTSKKGVIKTNDYEGYNALLKTICEFFRTGVPPVSNEETMELYRFMEAGVRSKRLGGVPVTLESVDSPILGNWGLKLDGYPRYTAGHLIVERGEDGTPRTQLLWRYSSPLAGEEVEVNGDKAKFIFPKSGGFYVEVKADGDALTGEAYKLKDGKREHLSNIVGWRNPPIEYASTDDAILGEPIDLLKDGLDGWETMNDQAKFGWKFKDGVLSNELGKKADGTWAGGGANLKTKRNDFYDFNLEFDVRVPKDSNSGVYLRGLYEIQVVDSFGKTNDVHSMASYYGRVAPSKSAEKPAGEWQHVSATIYRRHLTVELNGQRIIDNAPVVGITGGAFDAHEQVEGPLYLQGDHSDADYRNMILRKAR